MQTEEVKIQRYVGTCMIEQHANFESTHNKESNAYGVMFIHVGVLVSYLQIPFNCNFLKMKGI